MGLFGVVPEKGGFRHEGPVFYGVVPERGLFRARVWPHFALTSPSTQSEDEICRGEEGFGSILPHLNSNWSNLSLIRFH